MNNKSKCEDFLKEQDMLSLPHRAKRLKFLVEKFGELQYIGLPQMAFYYFEGARLCYLNGTFAACVLIVQAALEDILRSFFRFSGDDKITELGFKGLIDECLRKNLINEEEAINLHNVRKCRNPYVHTKDPMHPKGLIGRMQKSNFEKDDWDLMKEDAENAIICLFDFIKRHPFSIF